MNGHCEKLTNGFDNHENEIHPPVPCSSRAINTFNPIRNIVDQMKIEPNVNKKLIHLSIGDPTTFGNLPISEATKQAVLEVMETGKCHGYGPSDGFQSAKEAVAQFYTTDQSPLTSNDVILTSSCSGAIDLSIGAIAEAGSNILIPRPGFSIYQTLTTVYNVNVNYYDLLPEQNWEIDLCQMESLIDENTSAIIVCNPSNPCGSVWSLNHIQDVISIAEKHKLPIISDEIYADMVFSESTFTPFARVSRNVPVLTMGGLAKRWLVPGWRIGWILTRQAQPTTICQKRTEKLVSENCGPDHSLSVGDSENSQGNKRGILQRSYDQN